MDNGKLCQALPLCVCTYDVRVPSLSNTRPFQSIFCSCCWAFPHLDGVRFPPYQTRFNSSDGRITAKPGEGGGSMIEACTDFPSCTEAGVYTLNVGLLTLNNLLVHVPHGFTLPCGWVSPLAPLHSHRAPGRALYTNLVIYLDLEGDRFRCQAIVLTMRVAWARVTTSHSCFERRVRVAVGRCRTFHYPLLVSFLVVLGHLTDPSTRSRATAERESNKKTPHQVRTWWIIVGVNRPFFPLSSSSSSSSLKLSTWSEHWIL